MKKLFTTILLAILSLSLLACGGGNEPAETTAPLPSASLEGVTPHGYIKAAELPSIADLSEWYALAVERKTVTNALIYSKSATDNIWHCWFYLGCYTEGDSLLFAQDSNGEIRLSVAAADKSKAGAEGAFYFTLQSDTEPSFSLLINNSPAGLLLTLADTSLAK